jgi:hypothetical protein
MYTGFRGDIILDVRQALERLFRHDDYCGHLYCLSALLDAQDEDIRAPWDNEAFGQHARVY